MTLSSRKNLTILRSLPDQRTRALFFAGGKATIGKVTQVQQGNFIDRYVGKVRGIVIQFNGRCIFDTPEGALENAKAYLTYSKSKVVNQ